MPPYVERNDGALLHGPVVVKKILTSVESGWSLIRPLENRERNHGGLEDAKSSIKRREVHHDSAWT